MRRSRERFRAWHPHCSTALSVDSAKPGGRVKRSKPYYDERPAAVILDVVMPGHMDALEALAAFKKIDREVPIIVLSGQGRTTTVVQAMKLGASDFVSEPFDETDLAVLPTRSNSGSSVAKWRRSASSCSRGPNTTCSFRE